MTGYGAGDPAGVKGWIIAVEAMALGFAAWQATGIALVEINAPLYDFAPLLLAQAWAIGIDFLQYLRGVPISPTAFKVVSVAAPVALAMLLALRHRAAALLCPVALVCWVLGGIGMMAAAGFQSNDITAEEALARTLFFAGLAGWGAACVFLAVLWRKGVLR